jgi:hypothetical protein
MRFLAFAIIAVEAWTSRTRCHRPDSLGGAWIGRQDTSLPSTSRGVSSYHFMRPPHFSAMKNRSMLRMSSDWASFVALDDDDGNGKIDRTDYAREEDTQERKAMVGVSLDPPTILQHVNPISVPAGTETEIVSPQVCDLEETCSLRFLVRFLV